jgi:hypothetical protein
MTDSVGPAPRFKKTPHINAIGYVLAAAIALIFLPLLPFVAVIWLMGQRGESQEPELA